MWDTEHVTEPTRAEIRIQEKLMTEPRDRHTAHSEAEPPWTIWTTTYDHETGEITDDAPTPMKPDHPVRKHFLRHQDTTSIDEFRSNRLAKTYYLRTDPVTGAGVPNLGMDTDEANAAVYLILLALVEGAGPTGRPPTAGQVVEVLDQFESTTGVSLGDVTETAAKAIIEWARSQP